MERVINQTYRNLQIVMTDDGLTDKALETIRQLEVNGQKIEVIISERGIGTTY